MFTICIQDLQFMAHHGCFEEEKLLGNKFTVNLEAVIGDNPVHNIHDTVDYVQLYNIIKKHMMIATPLLETILQNMVQEIFSNHPSVDAITATITKNYPPITDFVGKVAVRIQTTKAEYLSTLQLL